MRRLTVIAAFALLLAACGSETSGTGTVTSTTTTTPTTSTTLVSSTLPGAAQRELLDAARQLWAEQRPDRYYLRYGMECECIPGPFEVYVDEFGTFSALDVTEPDSGYVPFISVDAVFDDILRTLETGDVPVDVEYHPEYGLPMVYSYNPPGQPVDAGFIMRVGIFEPDEAANAGEKVEARRRLEEATGRWLSAGVGSYVYTFSRLCFCPQEWQGPYDVTVSRGKIVNALYEGRDIRDVLDVDSYEGWIERPHEVLQLLRQALGSSEAGDVQAEYHPELGYPMSASIDWIEFAVDDEVTYTISDLGPIPPQYPETCSAAALNVDLVDQPGLPERVATTRQAIYDAAINCDFEALVAITEASPYFEESLGGGSDPGGYWADLEERGGRVIEAMIVHLNLPYTNEEETFIWPSAIHLESPGGAGIPPEDYEALLTVYSEESLQEMFDTIGGYVGWRLAILANGDWISFLAGD